MSQLGLFLLEDEDTILQIKAKALTFVLAGNPVMSWDGEGTSVSKQWAISPTDILEECNFALKQLNPAQYGKLLKIIKPFHM